jgi:hypothetical protein
VIAEELNMIPEEVAEETGGRKLTTFALSFPCYRVEISGGEIPLRIFEDFCGYAGRYLVYDCMAVPWMEDWWAERIKAIPTVTIRTVLFRGLVGRTCSQPCSVIRAALALAHTGYKNVLKVWKEKKKKKINLKIVAKFFRLLRFSALRKRNTSLYLTLSRPFTPRFPFPGFYFYTFSR